MLGIKSLIVDREDRIGDNWRTRYHQYVYFQSLSALNKMYQDQWNIQIPMSNELWGIEDALFVEE